MKAKCVGVKSTLKVRKVGGSDWE